jgi:flagellar biosynthesis anti-sigma factor FlgM
VRINPSTGLTGAEATEAVRTASTSQGARPIPSARQDRLDQANLSPDAIQLSNLSSALAKVPPIRQNRVTEVTQALRSGNHVVSDHQIAQSMLRDFPVSSSSG